MEGAIISEKRPLEDLSLSLKKPPFAARPHFTMISPSGSINASRNHYLLNHGEASSSGTIRCPMPFSLGEKASPMEAKLPNSRFKMTPYLSIEKNRTSFDHYHAVANANKGRAPPALEQAIEYELKCGRRIDPSMDPKKLRRTISNRLSAQRSRMRKVQYINDMEKKVKELQDTISLLSPQLASYTRKQKILRMQKTMLQEQLESCMEKSKLCNKQIEENKVEVKRLKELHKSLKKHALTSSSSEKDTIYQTDDHHHERPAAFLSLHRQSDHQQPIMGKIIQHGEVEHYLNLDAFSQTQPVYYEPEMGIN